MDRGRMASPDHTWQGVPSGTKGRSASFGLEDIGAPRVTGQNAAQFKEADAPTRCPRVSSVELH